MVGKNIGQGQLCGGCRCFWCKTTAGRLEEAIEIHQGFGAVGIGGDIGDAVLNRPGAHGTVEGKLVAEPSREVHTGIGRSRLARELLVLYEVVEGQGLGIDRVGRRGRIRWQGANNGLGQLQLKTEAIGGGCGGASISNKEQGPAQLNPLNHAGI